MLELLCARRNKGERYVITGDVDFENVSKSKFYYPVPGGGYDDTMLLKNTLLAREMKMLKLEK
jgi:methylenetetrahydrofolate dehydrogenase (NADP+)/methenyltetrahydrofolate cyclohydrolase